MSIRGLDLHAQRIGKVFAQPGTWAKLIRERARRILAWTVGEKLNPMNTCLGLNQAAAKTKVYMDSGVENLNKDVDKLLEGGTLERIIAQIDVSFSNSLIESWWRSLEHGWLFINHLDNVATLQKLVEFYVVEHNTVMAHSVFDGRTPDEMYFSRGEAVPDELVQKRREARSSRRVEENRKLTCSNCPRRGAVASEDIAA